MGPSTDEKKCEVMVRGVGDRCWHTAGRTDGLDGGRGVLSAPIRPLLTVPRYLHSQQ